MPRYTYCLRGRVFSPDGLVKLVFRKDSGVIVGVHLIAGGACDMVHYGLDLVDQTVTIFSLIPTLFTAVTFHDLFEEAALDGSSELAFGVRCQAITTALRALMADSVQAPSEDRLRKEFQALDTGGYGSLNAERLRAVFKSVGQASASDRPPGPPRGQ